MTSIANMRKAKAKELYAIKNPKKMKEEQNRQSKSLQNSLHMTENQIVDGFKKTILQQELSRLLYPLTTKSRNGQPIYLKKQTIMRVSKILNELLYYSTPREAREIIRTLSFINNSAIARVQRNKEMSHREDSGKIGHKVARIGILNIAAHGKKTCGIKKLNFSPIRTPPKCTF